MQFSLSPVFILGHLCYIAYPETVLSFSSVIHFFIFIPALPMGGSREQQPQEDSNYIAVNSNLRQFGLLHAKMGPGKVGDVVAPPGPGRPLGRFPVCVASRTCFTILSWDILHTWPN